MRPEARPTPLQINKESQRIRKHPPMRLPIVQHRQPTIIHIYSPKVIRTHPNEFMSLVQRLTGSVNVHTKDHFTSYRTALTSPLASASPDLLDACVNLNVANSGGFTSPRTSQPQQVKAHEAPFNPVYEDTASSSLALSSFFLQSPAASRYNALASPPLWSEARLAVSTDEDNYSLAISPLFLPSPASRYNALASSPRYSSRPTRNVPSELSLAYSSFLSPGKQGPANNPALRLNTITSPQLTRYPANTPKAWYQQFLADLLSLSPEKQGPADNLVLASPWQFVSPQVIRHEMIFPSLRTSL